VQRTMIKAMDSGSPIACPPSAFPAAAGRRGRGACLDERLLQRVRRQSIVAQARLDGYTSTIMGRRRYLPDLTADNRQRPEMAEWMALNAPIQGPRRT
jgi:hypothetical protein